MSQHGASGVPGKPTRRGRPVQPGEVLNPEGRNQYTYKREFERSVERLLKGELSAEEAESVPKWVRELVEPGMTRAEALAAIVVVGALRGEEKWLIEALKRLWPATEKRELSGPGGAPLPVETHHRVDISTFTDEEREQLIRLAHKALDARDGTAAPDSPED